MKEFITAVEDIVAEDEREEALAAREDKINELIAASAIARETFIQAEMEAGKTKKSASAKAPKVLTRAQAEEQVPEVDVEDPPIEFLLDGRVMHAYPPTEGQLAFMMAGLGRGQTDDGRAGTMVNVMLASLRGDDKDHFESRLLLPKRDPKRLTMKTIEVVFEYIMEEWFARPTQ